MTTRQSLADEASGLNMIAQAHGEEEKQFLRSRV